jgi:hypothetical protein
VLVWGQDNFTLLTQHCNFSLGQGLNTTPGKGRSICAFRVLDSGVQGLHWNSKIKCGLVDAHTGLRGEADSLDFEFFGVDP